jgi:hypothetical protein
LVKPIPPADSVAKAVRALNTILSQLAGKEALAALKAGEPFRNVDTGQWAPAWEGARTFRDFFLINLARMTRDEWRRDVHDIVENQPEFNRANMIGKALDARLRIAIGFVFCYLTPRHACMLGDLLMLSFETEMKVAEFARELAASASRAPHQTPAMLDAIVLGASQMHRYQPERLLSANTTASDFAG